MFTRQVAVLLPQKWRALAHGPSNFAVLAVLGLFVGWLVAGACSRRPGRNRKRGELRRNDWVSP
jgi:hypothetical protein